MTSQSLTPIITVINGIPKTTSVDIAEHFGKQHNNVLRTIRNLDIPQEWGLLNFEQTPYVDPQNGQTYPAYNITRDGFTILVMGFTGKQAMDWKIKYIEAFNLMEAELKKPPQPQQKLLPEFITPAHKRELSNAITKKVYAYTTDKKFRRILFERVYGQLKDKFHTNEFKELLDSDFDDARKLIEGIVFDAEPVDELKLPKESYWLHHRHIHYPKIFFHSAARLWDLQDGKTNRTGTTVRQMLQESYMQFSPTTQLFKELTAYGFNVEACIHEQKGRDQFLKKAVALLERIQGLAAEMQTETYHLDNIWEA